MEFFIKYWKEILIVSFIGIAVYKYNAMESEIIKLTTELATEKERSRQLKATIEGLGDYMTEQNDAVMNLKKLSDKQDEELKKAEHQSELIEEEYNKKIRVILQDSVPKDCKGASNWLLNKSIEGEYRWSK